MPSSRRNWPSSGKPGGGLGLPPSLREDRHERERVEAARQNLRAEAVLPDADNCPACAEARLENEDPTFLCRDHLAALAGL